MKKVKPGSWLLRAAVCAVLLARPAVGAAPDGDGGCFWNPVTRQCAPDEMLYAQPVAGLDAAQVRLFDDGLKQFRAPWTMFPRADGEWGLGPFFHANACTGCHVNVGRGQVDEQSARVVRPARPRPADRRHQFIGQPRDVEDRG